MFCNYLALLLLKPGKDYYSYIIKPTPEDNRLPHCHALRCSLQAVVIKLYSVLVMTKFNFSRLLIVQLSFFEILIWIIVLIRIWILIRVCWVCKQCIATTTVHSYLFFFGFFSHVDIYCSWFITVIAFGIKELF